MHHLVISDLLIVTFCPFHARRNECIVKRTGYHGICTFGRMSAQCWTNDNWSNRPPDFFSRSIRRPPKNKGITTWGQFPPRRTLVNNVNALSRLWQDYCYYFIIIYVASRLSIPWGLEIKKSKVNVINVAPLAKISRRLQWRENSSNERSPMISQYLLMQRFDLSVAVWSEFKCQIMLRPNSTPVAVWELAWA